MKFKNKLTIVCDKEEEPSEGSNGDRNDLDSEGPMPED